MKIKLSILSLLFLALSSCEECPKCPEYSGKNSLDPQLQVNDDEDSCSYEVDVVTIKDYFNNRSLTILSIENKSIIEASFVWDIKSNASIEDRRNVTLNKIQFNVLDTKLGTVKDVYIKEYRGKSTMHIVLTETGGGGKSVIPIKYSIYEEHFLNTEINLNICDVEPLIQPLVNGSILKRPFP